MFKGVKQVFVVGIGGVGISALVRLLYAKGCEISGSDLKKNEIADNLTALGIRIKIGHSKANLPSNTDLLIYSTAVPTENPERQEAQAKDIRELSYPEALGEIAQDYQVVAVAGTNGKTTTTAMIGTILMEVGKDPTVLVGSKVFAWNSNARIGKGNLLVLEADEYRRAFLNYTPNIAVITNIAADHLDYYRDLDDIKEAFTEFTKKIKDGGTLVYNQQDENTELVARRFIGKKRGFYAKSFKLRVPGKFNQVNAAAAAAACEALGISKEKILSGLEKFTGTWRRFEKIGRVGDTEIISDYAHHPEGVRVTLETTAEVYPRKRILAVFQPHQRNRTKKLFLDFVRVFCEGPIRNLIISEIFDVAGREEKQDQAISSLDLVREIQKCGKQVTYAKDLPECEQRIREIAGDFDVVVFMGAGDIYQVANNLAKR